MYELVFYKHTEAGFESFPAENYVDYMTNVMPVPERHIFFLPKRGRAIICEVKSDANIHVWSLREYLSIPSDAIEKQVDVKVVDKTLSMLIDRDEPSECCVCENFFTLVF